MFVFLSSFLHSTLTRFCSEIKSILEVRKNKMPLTRGSVSTAHWADPSPTCLTGA